MKYLHTMVRVSDIDQSLAFYQLLGLRELRRYENEAGRFTLLFLAAPGDDDAQIELTYNWDEKGYGEGRNFGHLAYRVDDIYATCQRLMDLGCDQLSLGDTIGVGTPLRVQAAMERALAHYPLHEVSGHFHDTYGQALSNTMAALSRGVRAVDASAGGLGGCPYAKSATGNLATEDLVWALEGMGIEHGVDLEKLVATSVWMAEQLGKPSASRVVKALAG